MCMTRMSVFDRAETVTITPLRAFPVIRDLVTDVSFNYEKAREIPSFVPPAGLSPGEYRMFQEDVDRSQEFRKCIECYLCQNTCHVVRDHEENKQAFAGPRYLMRVAELDMHPLDSAAESGLDRRRTAQDEHGLGYCNITKCCTEVCPEGIRITDNALIPLKERAVDRKYDPLVWLGSKIGRAVLVRRAAQSTQSFRYARQSASVAAKSTYRATPKRARWASVRDRPRRTPRTAAGTVSASPTCPNRFS